MTEGEVGTGARSPSARGALAGRADRLGVGRHQCLYHRHPPPPRRPFLGSFLNKPQPSSQGQPGTPCWHGRLDAGGHGGPQGLRADAGFPAPAHAVPAHTRSSGREQGKPFARRVTGAPRARQGEGAVVTHHRATLAEIASHCSPPAPPTPRAGRPSFLPSLRQGPPSRKRQRAEPNISRLEVIKFLVQRILLLSLARNELVSAFNVLVIVSLKNLIKHCWILLIIINKSDNLETTYVSQLRLQT